MTKCTINSNNEITNFWNNDTHAPVEAVECDRLPFDKIHGIGSPDGEVFLYKLVDGVVTPTEDGISWKAEEYARNRKAEYDQLNQFEMQFDDDRDGTTTWVDTINEIKGRHPK